MIGGTTSVLIVVDRSLPDLIVLDLMLPWVNGVEVLATLRGRADLAGIPVLVTSLNRDSRDPPPSRAPGAPRTVLVIEDDASVRHFFMRALDFAGVEVVEAWSCEVALRLIDAGLTPDAVLLDLSMPGMNGWGFLREFHRDPAHQAIPIAIITGHLVIPDDARAIATALGVSIHHKPVTLEALLTLTSELLERRSA